MNTGYGKNSCISIVACRSTGNFSAAMRSDAAASTVRLKL
jgi:hypothetical protein